MLVNLNYLKKSSQGKTNQSSNNNNIKGALGMKPECEALLSSMDRSRELRHSRVAT